MSYVKSKITTKINFKIYVSCVSVSTAKNSATRVNRLKIANTTKGTV
jgi:hypothetical protein